MSGNVEGEGTLGSPNPKEEATPSMVLDSLGEKTFEEGEIKGQDDQIESEFI